MLPHLVTIQVILNAYNHNKPSRWHSRTIYAKTCSQNSIWWFVCETRSRDWPRSEHRKKSIYCFSMTIERVLTYVSVVHIYILRTLPCECKILKFVVNFVICQSCYLRKEPGRPKPINITDKSSRINMQPVTTANAKNTLQSDSHPIFFYYLMFLNRHNFYGIVQQYNLVAYKSTDFSSASAICLAMQPLILPSYHTSLISNNSLAVCCQFLANWISTPKRYLFPCIKHLSVLVLHSYHIMCYAACCCALYFFVSQFSYLSHNQRRTHFWKWYACVQWESATLRLSASPYIAFTLKIFAFDTWNICTAFSWHG